MGTHLIKVVALLGCLGTLALAACGSDDDDGGESSEPVSHAELVEQATAACADAQARSNELNEELGGGDVFAPEAAEIVAELAIVTEELAVELRSIEPPEEDAANYDEFVSFLEDGTDTVAQIAAAVEDGDREAAQAAQEELNTEGADIEGIAADLGLEACLDSGSG